MSVPVVGAVLAASLAFVNLGRPSLLLRAALLIINAVQQHCFGTGLPRLSGLFLACCMACFATRVPPPYFPPHAPHGVRAEVPPTPVAMLKEGSRVIGTSLAESSSDEEDDMSSAST